MVLGKDHFESLDEDGREETVQRFFYMDEVIDNAVSVHFLDLLSMEKEIRKTLLPSLFEMAGFENAKEMIVHVTCINRSKGEF